MTTRTQPHRELASDIYRVLQDRNPLDLSELENRMLATLIAGRLSGKWRPA